MVPGAEQSKANVSVNALLSSVWNILTASNFSGICKNVLIRYLGRASITARQCVGRTCAHSPILDPEWSPSTIPHKALAPRVWPGVGMNPHSSGPLPLSTPIEPSHENAPTSDLAQCRDTVFQKPPLLQERLKGFIHQFRESGI